jgi:hypothetical protein
MTAMAAPDQSITTSASYERFAGVCAILTGVVGLVYSVAFVVLKIQTLYSVCLLLGGLLGSAALIAVYGRLRQTDASFALWALLLGIAGALGSAVHAAHDLAVALHPPTIQLEIDAARVVGAANLPNAADPRGFLTFGVAGLGLLVIAWLMLKGSHFPRGLGYLGYVLAALLIVLYLARLIVLDATSPLILAPAALAGFLANPIFYVWLGLTFWRAQR